MLRILRSGIPLLIVLLVGVVGGMAFTDLGPRMVCDGTYLQEIFEYAQSSDGGFGTVESARASEIQALGASDDIYVVDRAKTDMESGSDWWIVSKDGRDVAAFSLRSTESGRSVVDSRIVCVEDDGKTPLDQSLDYSRMTDFDDFSTYITEEEWKARQQDG